MDRLVTHPCRTCHGRYEGGMMRCPACGARKASVVERELFDSQVFFSTGQQKRESGWYALHPDFYDTAWGPTKEAATVLLWQKVKAGKARLNRGPRMVADLRLPANQMIGLSARLPNGYVPFRLPEPFERSYWGRK